MEAVERHGKLKSRAVAAGASSFVLVHHPSQSIKPRSFPPGQPPTAKEPACHTHSFVSQRAGRTSQLRAGVPYHSSCSRSSRSTLQHASFTLHLLRTCSTVRKFLRSFLCKPLCPLVDLLCASPPGLLDSPGNVRLRLLGHRPWHRDSRLPHLAMRPLLRLILLDVPRFSAFIVVPEVNMARLMQEDVQHSACKRPWNSNSAVEVCPAGKIFANVDGVHRLGRVLQRDGDAGLVAEDRESDPSAT